MSIKHAILGFLSWRPMSGYDLKKAFGEVDFVPWAGSNNQIYNSLLELQRDGLVSFEVLQPERGPARKLYTISAAGTGELDRWLAAGVQLPEWQNAFMLQLAWADRLGAGELDALLADYERRVAVQLAMVREAGRRTRIEPGRTLRERFLWERIAANRAGFFERELAWVRETRAGLEAT